MTSFSRPEHPLVFSDSIDIPKRPVVVDLNITAGGRMLADNQPGAARRLSSPHGVEQRSLDQNRVAVLLAADRANDRRVSLVIAIDDRAYCVRTHERDIDERDERRHHSRPIDGVQPAQQRRELPAVLVVGVGDEPRRRASPVNAVTMASASWPTTTTTSSTAQRKRPHDARQKRLAVLERKSGFGRPMRVDLPAASTIAGITVRS